MVKIDITKTQALIGLVVGILLSISIFAAIMPDAQTSGEKFDLRNASVANESFIAHNATDGVSTLLAHNPYVSGSLYVVNATTFNPIGANNFTVTSSGAITLSTAATGALKLNGSSLLASYKYEIAAIPLLGAFFGDNNSIGFGIAIIALLIGIMSMLYFKYKNNR